MFQQELYHNFSISSSRSYFLSFAGDVSILLVHLVVDDDVISRCFTPLSPPSRPTPPQTCQVGLNFASEEEARRFRAAISDLLNRRQRKTGEKVPPPTHLPHFLLILLISCSTPDWSHSVLGSESSWQHTTWVKSRPSSSTTSWNSALCDVTKDMTRLPGPVATTPGQVLAPPPETASSSSPLQVVNIGLKLLFPGLVEGL